MNAMAKHARISAAWALLSQNPVLPVIAGIGFAVSFQTITALAREQHMPGWPVLYPILIDVFLLGLVVEARKAIDDNRSDLVPRALAWLLAGFTLYVNAHGSPARDWLGIALHVTAPVAWITFLELTRWRKLRKRRAERGDTIPLARWLIAPVRTAGMRKRMVLHNVSSYAEASAREEARMLGMDLAAAVFGKRWRRDAPPLLRHHLREGTLPATVAQACSFQSREVPELAEAWVMRAKEQRERVAAKSRQITAGSEGQAGAATNGSRVRATSARGSTRRKPATRGPARDDIDTHAEALRILSGEPDISGSELGRRLGKDPSYGRVLKKKLTAGAPATGPIPAVRAWED
jgi:Protein of unknown function (DUF2637)